MRNWRKVFWLLLSSLLAFVANFVLDAYSPALRTVRIDALVPPSFEPTEIVLKRAGVKAIVLKKHSDWRIESPFAGNADDMVVMRLLDAMRFSPVEDSVSEAELIRFGRSRSNFISDPPELSVGFSDGRKSISVFFGTYTPSSNGVYAAIAGSEELAVVPSAVFSVANINVDAFRQKVIFPLGTESILSFDVKRPAGQILGFVRDGDSWRSGDAVASSAKIKEFLSLFAAAKACDFVWPVGETNESGVVSASLLSGYGLDSESASTVTFRYVDGREARISLGNVAGEKLVYALVQNGREIVTVHASLKDAAVQNAVGFTDSRLFPVEMGAVKSFAIEDVESKYVFSVGDSGMWLMDAPIVAPANQDVVKRVLDGILSLSLSDVAVSGVKVSVNTGSDHFIVSPLGILGGNSFADFRSKEVVKVDPAQVKRLVVSSKKTARPVSVVYSKERRSWDVETSDRHGVVNEEAISKILKVLDPLTAQRVVALKANSSDLVRYGLEDPFFKVAVDQNNFGAVRRNILVGSKTEGGYFATVGSADAIFVIPEKTVEALMSELIDD